MSKFNSKWWKNKYTDLQGNEQEEIMIYTESLKLNVGIEPIAIYYNPRKKGIQYLVKKNDSVYKKLFKALNLTSKDEVKPVRERKSKKVGG